VACYAWNKKKYLSDKVGPGEGLVGQAWQEGDLIYLTDVPDGFVRITSGLGDINPNAIVLLPLKQNDEVMGVIELAFFNKVENHELELLQKISENLASSLASVRINERTKKLLSQTQEQTEALRSQEEEMRQNLEEMKTTQEEFNRREAEYIREFERLKNVNGVVLHT
jgi:transcriptional regulator with GAF, ATPase, and Fis domain